MEAEAGVRCGQVKEHHHQLPALYKLRGEHGTRFSLRALRSNQHCQHSALSLLAPKLSESKFLLFQAPQFVLLYYNISRKLTQPNWNQPWRIKFENILMFSKYCIIYFKSTDILKNNIQQPLD